MISGHICKRLASSEQFFVLFRLRFHKKVSNFGGHMTSSEGHLTSSYSINAGISKFQTEIFCRFKKCNLFSSKSRKVEKSPVRFHGYGVFSVYSI
jgi:hypothetical protein